MGVPITFLDKFNLEQFEIIDSRTILTNKLIHDNLGMIKNNWGTINGHPTYARILIRNKNPQN